MISVEVFIFVFCVFSLSFYIRQWRSFNRHFPGRPGLAGTRTSSFWILFEIRMMRRWWWQTSSKIVATNKPTLTFYRLAAFPVAQPQFLEYCREKDLITANSPGVFQLCLWLLKAAGYLGRGFPSLSSSFLRQYPILVFIYKTYIGKVDETLSAFSCKRKTKQFATAYPEHECLLDL